METLANIAAILDFYGPTAIRFRVLWWYPGRSEEGIRVAEITEHKALMLSPIWEGSTLKVPARMVRNGEDPGDLAAEIARRVGALPAKAA